MRFKLIFTLPILLSTWAQAQTVDFSSVSMQEEKGLDLKKITSDNDYVYMPPVKKAANSIDWMSNNIIALSPDNEKIGWISVRNNTTNIFIRSLNGGTSQQRTNRQNVLDFNFSPDGTKLCFSETNGKTNRIFVTDASKGYVCRQITNNEQDYAPIFSNDMKHLFFTRQEKNSFGIWSFNLAENSLSNITNGLNPYPIKEQPEILCVRQSNNGKNEVWKVNYETGDEICIVSDMNISFSSPIISPDGKWILMVGSSILQINGKSYPNTDIFVCSLDGSNLMQLTYHPANDLCPQWSQDGKYIYFVSQRGSSTKNANIWRLTFKEN